MVLKIIHEQKAFDGTVGFYAHASMETKTEMKFAIFLPPQARQHKVPGLYYLAGLTCTEETFMIKANALRFAAERGLALIAPDTSPRGANLPGEDEDWDFGTGAGRERLPRRCSSARYIWAFNGRPWRADCGAQEPKPVSIGVRLCANI